MPVPLPTQNGQITRRRLMSGVRFPEYKERYLDGLNLDPVDNSPTSDHNRIVSALLRRIYDSYDVIRKRHEQWRKIDENLTAYIPLDEVEKKIKNADDRKPVRIVVPMTYATLDTLQSFYLGLLEDPIYRYRSEGSPEDIIGSVLLERHVAYQARRFKHVLALSTLARDSFAYGIGAVSPQWTQKTGFETVSVDQQVFGIDNGSAKVRRETVLYEGNKLQTINPYRLLIDPNVSISDYQDGEFIGWHDRTSKMHLLSMETEDETMFNVKYLDHFDGRSNIFLANDSARSTKFGDLDFRSPTRIENPADIVWMYCTLIPSSEEWKLGSSDRPQKWLFGLAGDSVLVKAEPMDLDHDMYPITISAPEDDGHSSTPLGRLEITYGMQQAVDFLINARLSNLRKMVNNLWAVDPSLINMNDVAKTRDGMIARLRKSAFGTGRLKDAIMNFPANDFSSTVFNDVGFFDGAVQRSTGTTEQQQGIGSASRDRVTATEIQALASGSGGKLMSMVQRMYWQYHYDLSMMCGYQTIQFAEEEIWTKIVGHGEQELREVYGNARSVPIKPSDLRMAEVMIHDGSNPAMGDINAWNNFFQIAAQIPEISEQYDISRIFGQFLRMQGVKNPESMKRTEPVQGVAADVQSDEDVQRQAEAGNVIPLNQAVNAL